MTSIQIRPVEPVDRSWVVDVLTQSWGSTRVVSRGQIHDAADLSGLVALIEDQPLGLATYRVEGLDCELITLNSLRPNMGIGTRLLEAVAILAEQAGCRRLWLVTTNDNLIALGFYQKQGFKLIGLHSNAIDRYRNLKPEIPILGEQGIPIRDELVLEKVLHGGNS